jgi:hypothetical protein
MLKAADRLLRTVTLLQFALTAMVLERDVWGACSIALTR